MSQLDDLVARARQDLVITGSHGCEEDVFLWEHAERVARSAHFILQLPEISQAKPDAQAVIAAALYHDVAWVSRLSQGEISREEILIRPVPDAHREQSAISMEKSLVQLMSPESLRTASTAIRMLNEREVEQVECIIVADAENLEEFGLLAFWPNIRRGVLEGKGVQAVVDTWHRRREYQFWAARLRDSFRLEPVRQLAHRRLQAYERVMGEIERLHLGADVEQVGAIKPGDHSPEPVAQ